MLRRGGRGSGTLAALVVAAALALLPRMARAQACCAGASIFAPARLAVDEDYLVGALVRGAAGFGSWDGGGAFSPAPAGTAELTFGQDLLGAVRLGRRAQVALVVPFVQTYRRARGAEEAGGGVGDLNASFRYDLTVAKDDTGPGVALLAGLSLPTGRPAEAAATPLATGATGTGAFQGHVAAVGELIRGPWLWNASLAVAARAPRRAGEVELLLAPRLSALAGGAYVFESGVSLGMSLLYELEPDAFVDGAPAAGTARRLLTAAAAWAWPFAPGFRLQGAFTFTPPLPAVSAQEPAAVGATLLFVHTGLGSPLP